ncbi:FecR family protein [Desulfosarcina ovata]|uniref:Anti-sigma factor FoxR n=1 Tax=Desulfosarcina ovata subsp. ovata TaxID=2752305 RepID=A0A5K8ADC3_9BACT|nr:FecR domain-containing protein [Desulfosarcina ovata]BBO90571.1 anti-sigma factor FoxR [Desulfosarcina ovata subsp. ovata]
MDVIDSEGNMRHTKKDQANGNASQVPACIIDQAIAWAVKLHSGMAKQADVEACAAWRAQEPMHETAWQRIQTVDRQLEAVPDGAGALACLTLENAFRNRSASRRHALKLAALAVMAVGTGLLVTGLPWQRRAAYGTDFGVRRSIELDDGSRIMLSSNTRLEVAYSLFRRTVLLKQGEVYIQTGSDRESVWGRRGFWVETEHARLEAIGTQFNVCEETGQTRLHVTDGAVAIELPTDRVIFHAGDTVCIDTAGRHLKRVDHLDYDPMAWTRGAIVAKRMCLAEFAAQLNRYHNGKVQVRGDIADLRVSGVFQLDGPDALSRALNALSNTLPVDISREGAFFVVR